MEPQSSMRNTDAGPFSPVWPSRQPPVSYHRNVSSIILIMLIVVLSNHSGFSQFWMEVNGPTQTSPCIEYPVEITLFNDDGDATPLTTVEVSVPDGFHYRVGSISSPANEDDLSDPNKPIFGIPVIEQCESFSFIIWMTHDCLSSDLEKEFTATWEGTSLSVSPEQKNQVRVFGLSIRMFDVRIFYDSTDMTFKKTFTLINNGQVGLPSLTFYVDGQDNMDILTTNTGTLSSNGDTIYFSDNDFENWGNGNNLFDPGEEIYVSHEINLNACNESFPFVHVMDAPCGNNICSYEVETSSDLKVTIGEPLLVVLQQADQTVTPCDSGIVNLKIYNYSIDGSFPEGNALYNLKLNPGWSVIQNNTRTEPRRDNCLRIRVAQIMGTNIPITTQGFSGYGLDFTRLTSDPDGPGGLSDLDGDGRYDDLRTNDTICLQLRYVLDPSCLNISCNGTVFSSRILRMESFYDDYCNDDHERNYYLGRHNYYWSGSGTSVGGLEGVYYKGKNDTLTITVAKSVGGFLNNCENDSAVIRVNFPRVVSLPPGAIILVNGDTATYTYSGNRVTILGDTNRFRIQIPVELDCDTGGGGSVQTACTFCVGSGFPMHRINVEMDYICNDGCYGRIPLACGNSSEFLSVCDSAAAGIISEGKFVIDDMILKRQSLGFTDSTKNQKISASDDSLNLETVIAFDTFNLEIPFDIRCDANYQNVLFRLIQSSLITISGNQRDTLKYFNFLSDTLKFYDGETNQWSICTNVLGSEYFNTQNNGYRNTYIRDLNLSGLGCLNGSFSSQDSLILVVRGSVRNTLRNNVQRVIIRGDLQYRQDGCDQDNQNNIIFNAFSGIPHPGTISMSQPYQRDTNANRFYTTLSACGEFQLSVFVDNVYYNVDTIDPFKNEFRNPHELRALHVIIPQFFEIDSIPFNRIKEYFATSKGEFTRDTLKEPYIIKDSSGYHVIKYKVDQNQDFEALRNIYRINLTPDCYGFLKDSIRVNKYMRIQNHSSSPIPRDTVFRQYYPLNVAGIDPVISNPRQQFLFDSISITEFELKSGLQGYTPEPYFDFHYTWLTLQHNGNIQIDSLVEYTDTTSRLWPINPLGGNRFVYQLDTTERNRKFRLHAKVKTCERDTVRMLLGNSCDGYPSDFYDIGSRCEAVQIESNLFILPEVPDVQIKFLSTPDSFYISPCDTFEYVVEVRNSDLGHILSHELKVNYPDGLEYLSSEIEYPIGLWNSVLPNIQNNNLIFDFSNTFDSTGLKGYFDNEENHYQLRLLFVGTCDIQDGAAIVIESTGEDLCQNLISSGRINSPPLFFKDDSLSQPEDIYDLNLTFSGDSLCGSTFGLRAVFTSISNASLVDNQLLTLNYEKELSYIPTSYQNIRHAADDLLGYDQFENWEQIIIEVPDGIALGDSIIIEAQLERTCVGICKPTSLKFEALTPQNISCPSVPGGVCQLNLSTQEWSFDSLVIAPHYIMSNGSGIIERQMDGTEILSIEFEIENISQFGIKAPLIVEYIADQNANGMIDGSDLVVSKDTLDGQLIPALQRHLFSAKRPWPDSAGCYVLAQISPLYNDCICESDTIVFLPLDIKPQVDTVRDCYSNDIPVGFPALTGYSYDWLSPDIISGQLMSEAIYRYSGILNKNNTDYATALVRATRNGGCQVVDTVFIEVYRPELIGDMQDSIRCHGDQSASLFADLKLADEPTTYTWATGENGPGRQNLGAGIYEVVAVDVNGCRDTLSIEITEPDPVSDSITITSDYQGWPIACRGDSNGVITIIPNGGTPQYHYEWNGQMTTSNVINGLNAGWHYFKVVDKYGCQVEDSIFLDEPTPVEVSSGGTKAGCDDDHLASAYARALGGSPEYSYRWSNGMTGDSISNLTPGSYEVTVTDDNGCTQVDTLEIIQHEFPGISVNILDTLIEYGSRLRLHAQSTARSGVYTWFPSNEVSCDTCPFTFVNPTEPLTVEVRVVDENGCEAWAEINIRIQITKRVWAPNVITVNGDDLNDGFTLFGNKPLERIEYLRIFDRWGEQVFFKEDFEPGVPQLGWQGDLNGEFMNPAVFAWVAKVRFVDGEEEVLYGDVTVVK